MLSDEEFTEVFWSLTADEQIELCQKLHEFNEENQEVFNVSDETLAENELKLRRFIKVHEQKKQVAELLHKFQVQMDLVTQRIEARCFDLVKTDSNPLAGDDKKRRSH